MRSKKERQAKILELIREREIDTQEELARSLQKEGWEVTQATVSRDIRELALTKTRTPAGRFRYAAPVPQAGDDTDGRFARVMKDGVIRLDQAQNILVIHTVSGMAMAVAAALDAMHFPEVVGCIAGDDTIMAAVRTVADTTNLIRKIQEIVGEK